MIGDTPQVIRKAKVSWTEELFAEVYNVESRSYRLVLCSQDYQTFDYWLVDKSGLRPPAVVELKAHYKFSTERQHVGCDLVKIQKLRSLSMGSKGYIFHLFEDCTLIQDVEQPIDKFLEIEYSGKPVILGLVRGEMLKSISSVGLARLRKIQDVKRAPASREKSPDATAQD